MRFITYNVELDATAAAYVQTIAAMPEMVQWCAEAESESHRIAQYE